MQPILPGVSIVTCDVAHSIGYVTASLRNALEKRNVRTDCGLTVFHGGIAQRIPEPSNAVILTYWETDELPPDYVAYLNSFRAVGVCNGRELLLFRKQLDVPVFYFPHGTDAHACHRSREPRFTFMAVGETHGIPTRKRIAEIVALFSIAFPVEKDVQLIVKQSPRCPEIPCFDSRVTIIRESLNRSDMLRLMSKADVGVFLGAWESWGHPQLEFMAMGRPIITSRWGGLCEFFDSNCGIELPYKMVPTPPGLYYTHGQVPWTDDDAFVRAMRDLYYNPAAVSSFGAAAAKKAVKFTWNRSAKELINELSKTCTRP